MARPKVQIDWHQVGEMLVAGCDTTSVATALGISTDTLYVRSKRDNKLDFSAFSQQKRALGNDLLRRKQFEVAMSGNVPMLIWLGKNRLGQAEKQEVKAEVTAPSQIDLQGRFESYVNNIKRVYEALILAPEGFQFDPNNAEHRHGLRDRVRETLITRQRIYPEEGDIFPDWEEMFEKLRLS